MGSSRIILYLVSFLTIAHCHFISILTGEDCDTCGPKVTSSDDVADVAVPEWKKRALDKDLNANSAPFGMSDWNTEASTSATDAVAVAVAVTTKPETAKEDSGSHSHEHAHSHDHGHS